MRMSIATVLLSAAFAAGCHMPAVPLEPTPVLFPVDGEYELLNPNNEVTGYIYAETQSNPGQQFLRWVLLDNYIPPHIQPVTIRRAMQSSKEPPLPQTAAEFADFARDLVAAGDHVTYAKSYADTYYSDYQPTSTAITRKIVKVPIPVGRRPPDPPGVEAPYDWAGFGRYQEIDEGSVGLKRAPPPNELPGGTGTGGGSLGGGGGGYYDPEQAAPTGLIGMIVASPPEEEEHENWFIPDVLFESGVDGVTLLPFANQASPVTDAPSTQWVVVVVNSSYYPGFVPNDW